MIRDVVKRQQSTRNPKEMETPEPILLEFVQFMFHIVFAKNLLDYLILDRILSKLYRNLEKT